MMSHRFFPNPVFMDNSQVSTSPLQLQPVVKFDEDGEVIMQGAPGADPEQPLLDQWEQWYRARK